MQKISIMEKLNPVLRNQIEDELLSTVGRKYRNETFWIIFLGLITVGGTIAWVMQLRNGLGVTAMNDYVSWGLYISLLFSVKVCNLSQNNVVMPLVPLSSCVEICVCHCAQFNLF